MTPKGRDARSLAVLGSVTVICFSLGCQSSGGSFSFLRKPSPEASRERSAKVSPVPREDEESEDVLGQIQEFLSRTEEYRASGGGGSSPDVSSTLVATKLADQHSGDDKRSTHSDSRPSEQSHAAVTNSEVAIDSVIESSPPALPVVRSVSILSPHVGESSEPVAVIDNTTNKALDAGSVSTTSSIDDVVRHLRDEWDQHHSQVDWWRYKLTSLALDRESDGSVPPPNVVPDQERQILQAVLAVVRSAKKVSSDPLASGESAVEGARRLVQTLADRANPVISTIALCRKVTTFGVYEEIAADHLVAGRAIQAIVYSEIQNLTARRAEDDMFHTELGTRMEILTSDGRSVWVHEEPEISDRCRRRRNDFFMAQRITIPPTIAAGQYVLKVMVEDKLSGKAHESSHSFVVVEANAVTSVGS